VYKNTQIAGSVKTNYTEAGRLRFGLWTKYMATTIE